MPVAIPSAALRSQWAAEELWDWRVRALFAVVCMLAVLAALVIYFAWGKPRPGYDPGRARRYLGRTAVTLLTITGAEALFFKEPVSAALLVITTIVISLVCLGMPRTREAGANGQSDKEGAAPHEVS